MLTSDLDRLVDYMEELWPRWERTKALFDLWKKKLAPLDYERAKQAAEDHKIETGGYRSPQVESFLGKYRQARDSSGPANRDSGTGGYAGVYIECVEAPVGCPRLRGEKEPLCFGTDARVPAPDRARAIAQAEADKQAERYGGEWRVLDDPTGEIYYHRKIWEAGHD